MKHSMNSQDEALVGEVYEVVLDYLMDNECRWLNGAALCVTLLNRNRC